MYKSYTGENNRKRNQRETGSLYEKRAGEYLTKKGYRILQYNFRCRQGEIDLIAKDGDCYVFCEVKYRKDTNKGHPLEAVHEQKQRTISRCACFYLYLHGLDGADVRFDVIGICDNEITHIENAFFYVS